MPEHYTTDYQHFGPSSTCTCRSTHRSNRRSTCWCTGHPRPVGRGTAAAVGMGAVTAEAEVETLAAKAEVEALVVALAAGVEPGAALEGSATNLAVGADTQDALRRRSRRSRCPDRRPCTPNQGRHPHRCRCWR